MEFKSIYRWNVIDEIAKGKKVYALDRLVLEVFLVNELSVEEAVAMTESKEEKRFEFWYVETEETANETV
jgi:hypothetical protein